MYKNKKINGQNIRYFEKNNGSKWTIIFVHGFNSSSIFAKNLFTLKNEYNIIAIDMIPEDSKKDIEYDELVKIVKYFIKKNRNKKIILLGHSLAGGIVSKVGIHPRVKKVIFLSTITPSMIESKGYKFLKNHHQPKSKLALILSNKIEEKAKEKYEWVHKFLDRDSIWAKILNETVLDDTFMGKLDRRYKVLKSKSYFIVGKDDSVISTKIFISYVNSLKKEVKIIGVRHNPIKTAPKEVNDYLNKIVKDSIKTTKKRFFINK
ncbi:alpha/beta hydrolase [Mycoplasma marinum]|uniref:AB hydrolase-1 domain-containing protein n=1 Tax=Mycoplasma marinum TaxID=1937190 RepID=A0A4V2NI37_9MOLU|nr:alpha/beta hydrolase [Mycoplasma marinum]TCG11348.1 hypothetical protein C4B24_02235 [Mycoplasma marinum]